MKLNMKMREPQKRRGAEKILLKQLPPAYSASPTSNIHFLLPLLCALCASAVQGFIPE